MKHRFFFLACFLFCATFLFSQSLIYPHPVKFLSLTIEQQQAKMAYMDVPSKKPNGQTVVLFHGKNFNGFYWKEVIRFLNDAGYRVVVPDQIGWGQSDKPNIHYSFHLLAANTKKLLDTLGIQKANVIAHSMGGMLATRFALMYPQTVQKLIFENPIGLEDYKTFIPYTPLDVQYANELKASYESLKKYQQSYYPEWKPEYEPYVAAQYAALQAPDFKQATLASALTYQMIYEQPVVYEFKNITQPTLIIIGQEDRTVVGKNLLSKDIAAQHGNYPQLGKWLQQQISNSKLVELAGIGHIPHVQALSSFKDAVLSYLNQ
ncbi:MAG: alpha/beta hydrolase [Chitinophagaceae bacterium]|nr:MAG: alpha/beta hydrolase [Chitinophagaceae bacterium]